MATLYYPDSLPCPQTAPFTPAGRVRQSELPGLMQFAGRERDFRGTQEVTFTFNATEAALFDAWWRMTLSRGGLWFATTNWPLPPGWGATGVRRFSTPPQWSAIGNGYWRVSATTEIRGRSLLPDDGVEADPLWADVVLLVGQAGGPGASDIIDQSQYANTPASNTGVTWDGSKIIMANSQALLRYSGALFSPDNKKISIDGWFVATGGLDLAALRCAGYINDAQPSDYVYAVRDDDGSGIGFDSSAFGSPDADKPDRGFITEGVPFHLMIESDESSRLAMIVNGSDVVYYNAGGQVWSPGDCSIDFGAHTGGASFDERFQCLALRVTIGNQFRFGSNSFTPPSLPYPTQGP